MTAIHSQNIPKAIGLFLRQFAIGFIGKSRAARILYASVAVVALILTASNPATAGDRQVAATPPVYAALPAMDFTLPDGTRLRELRLRVVLELPPETDPATVIPSANRIATTMTGLLHNMEARELSGANGSQIVKRNMLQAARTELHPLEIRQVLVQEMIIH